MANLSETLTRDRPPQKVVIGNRVTRAELDPLLAAHARFLAGRIDGRRAVRLRCDLRGLDLRRIDLSGAALVGCDLEGRNLPGACLRTEARRGGEGCVRSCRPRWSAPHKKKQ